MSQQMTVADFRRTLTGSMRDEVAKQLPTGVDPERFIRTAITVVQMNPDLLEANRTSLFGAVMLAAKDGLLPDGREATIQIYNTKVRQGGREAWIKQAQYMPMVQGLLKKMYEAGAAYIDAAAVYAKDHFVFARGDNPRLEHEPDIASDDPGPVVASYAIVKLANGEIKREVMPRRDIEKVRSMSRAAEGPGWTKWYDQFAIKAVLKRIYKQLPQESDELQRVIEHDNAAMGFGSLDALIEPPDNDTGEDDSSDNLLPNKSGRPSRLNKIIQDADTPDEEPVPAEEPHQHDVQF